MAAIYFGDIWDKCMAKTNNHTAFINATLLAFNTYFTQLFTSAMRPSYFSVTGTIVTSSVPPVTTPVVGQRAGSICSFVLPAITATDIENALSVATPATLESTYVPTDFWKAFFGIAERYIKESTILINMQALGYVTPVKAVLSACTFTPFAEQYAAKIKIDNVTDHEKFIKHINKRL